MSTHKTKLVHCNTITYVYDYVSSSNISNFTFEDESLQLQRLILTNFVKEYLVDKLVLNVDKQKLSTLKPKLLRFLSAIESSASSHQLEYLSSFGIKIRPKYLAILQNDDERSCLHVLTNTRAHFTDQRLTELWGDSVQLDVLPYTYILNEFATLISNNNNKAFKSNNLEKPLILHNEMADDFIEKHNLLESDEYHTYEIKDSKRRTTVTVNEYRNIP
ncbi:hypothetical protein ACIQVU_08075 [Lysinibacillus sp. NPDC098008]|uniref:hypothetical protein n=1 Tax=Lysinibacillus sp. NPDC098008 TaxID=3364146 RepID=UPI00381C65C6